MAEPVRAPGDRWGRRGAHLVPILLVVGVVAASCGTSMLDGAGDESATVGRIWWLMFVLGAIVFVAVLVLLAMALRGRHHHDGDGDGRGDGDGDGTEATGDRRSRLTGIPLIVAGGIVVPSLVVVLLLGVTVTTGDGLRREGAEGPLRVEVTGHRYWWDVRYPDLDVRTANEVHVPVGEDVQLVLRSEDVIHSFWVPSVAGKLDLVPGRENRMVVRIDEPGTYDGYCAEYCGLQHALMRFTLVAHEREGFERWSDDAGAGRPVPEPGDPEFEGWQVFLSVGCAYCHRIEGTPANSEFGPDLTNFGSRATIGAGAVANNRGELGGWILDPQGTKPGNAMPATLLEPADLDPLLDYLEGLGAPR